MTELLITSAKGAFKTQPVFLLIILSGLTVVSYLNKGFNSLTQSLLFVAVVLMAYKFWRWYIDSKKQVLINKANREIEVISYTIFGSRLHKRYPIMYFGAIRSYILVGNRARNVVELVTNDGARSLHLTAFLSNGARKFWSSKVETENPDAANLVTKVASFIPVQNLGFVGHHFGKLPVDIARKGFIKNIFK
jgi:hypothetical protein